MSINKLVIHYVLSGSNVNKLVIHHVFRIWVSADRQRDQECRQNCIDFYNNNRKITFQIAFYRVGNFFLN